MELSLKVSMEKRLWRVFFSPTQTPKDTLFCELMQRKSNSLSHMLSGRAVSVGTSISVFSYFYLITHSLID